jgi:hypothetical protein
LPASIVGSDGGARAAIVVFGGDHVVLDPASSNLVVLKHR